MIISTNSQPQSRNYHWLAYSLAALTTALFSALIYQVNAPDAGNFEEPTTIQELTPETSLQLVPIEQKTTSDILTSQTLLETDPQYLSEASSGYLTDTIVTAVTLINADNGESIQTIQNGVAINIARLPSTNLAIRAETTPSQVGSVVFDLDEVQRVENIQPYTLAGDSEGSYTSWDYALNEWYQLTATPYSEAEANGSEGTALTVNFSFVQNTSYNNQQAAAASFVALDVPVADSPALTPGLINAAAASESQINLNWQIDSDQILTANAEADAAQLAWFYKPPLDGNLSALLESFDYFILTKKDEPVRDLLVSAGKTPVLQYLSLDVIHDPCRQVLNPVGTPCDCHLSTYSNTVGWHPDDICRIRDNHPDWFLRNSGGEVIVEDDNFVFMDPGNSGWREFWLERAKISQEQEGWHGVFLDNLEASILKFDPSTPYSIYPDGLQKYPDDASFQQAWMGFIQYIYTSYFQPTGRPLLANIVSRNDWGIWHDYMTYLDGAMDEGWGVDWRDGYLSRASWEESLRQIEQTSAMGKQSILVSQGAKDDANRQGFTFASYLLIRSDNIAFRYTQSRTGGYSYPWLYDNYDAQLGQPLGNRYQVGGVWRRDFTGGSVWVNPDDQTWDIVIGNNIVPSLQLEISMDDGANFDVFSTVPLNEPLYMHTGLTPETTYCYRLRLVTSTASRPFSNIACATTLSANLSPSLNPMEDQYSLEGDNVLLALSGSDPDNDVVSFTIDGLPQGLSMDSTSGTIIGTLGAGTSDGSPYLISASIQDDRGSSSSVNFNWYVQRPTPTYTPTATFTATNTPTATFTATNTPTATFTATNTPTATFTATNTPTATYTPTLIPTNTATATPEIFPTATYTATIIPTDVVVGQILPTQIVVTKDYTPTPDNVVLSPEPKATMTPEIVADAKLEPELDCPVGTRMTFWGSPTKLRATNPRNYTVNRGFNEASQGGGLLVISGVGHPEINCPESGYSTCDDIQTNEAFNVSVDGIKLLNPANPSGPSVPDHGEHQWKTFFFPVDLEAGRHDFSFTHAEPPGGDVNSVWFKAAFCVVTVKDDETLITEEIKTEAIKQEIIEVDSGILPTVTPEPIEINKEGNVEVDNEILPTVTLEPEVTDEIVEPETVVTDEPITPENPESTTEETIVEPPTVETAIEPTSVPPTEVPVIPTATQGQETVEEVSAQPPTEENIIEEPTIESTLLPSTPQSEAVQPTEPSVEVESEVEIPQEQPPAETP